jgi:hypothetical protein
MREIAHAASIPKAKNLRSTNAICIQSARKHKGITAMPFEKGKSGNPGGRPKVVGEVQALAREYASGAVETLRGIMENIEAPPAARITAAIAILDRGFGRPHQTSEIVTVQKPVSEMSDEELIARIRELQEDGGTPSH